VKDRKLFLAAVIVNEENPSKVETYGSELGKSQSRSQRKDAVISYHDAD
jgi:hypothetical protein